MRLKTLVFALAFVGGCFFQAPLVHAQWNGRIFKVGRAGAATEIPFEELIQELKVFPTVLLGEKHYTRSIQQVEGKIIRDVVEATGSQNAFTTAWEFLNFSSQERTDQLYSKVVSGELSVQDFLKITQGVDLSELYAPVIEATRDLGGKLLGVNLSRAQKVPVVEKGLSGLDPLLLPPGFGLGGDLYFERFNALMAGHGSPEKIRHYFEAQCLTDDVMAYHLTETATTPQKFLISGGFHMEYFDGAAARLKIRLQSRPELSQSFALVRLIDASDFEEKELPGLLRDERYGGIADFVYFVDEPFVDLN